MKTKMRKILLMMSMLLMLPTYGHAEGKSLFITFKDNTGAEFVLGTKPEVTFADDKLTITTTATTATYELKSVRSFTYGISTGISQVVANGNFRIEGDLLIVAGAAANIRVAQTDGKLVPVAVQQNGQQTTVSLSSLHLGTVYVVSVNGKSFKFIRK